ncbi:MAG: class I SAM-dependent methyltransferase [Acidimicrobiales bacterium]
MKMNLVGRMVLNSPARALAQRRYVVPTLERLRVRLDGCSVLEIGCGCGVGTELLLDHLGAGRVDAIDLDPKMIRLATARLDGRATVRLGDMTELVAPDETYDAVADFGGIHLVPEWRTAISEIARVLRPGGRYVFEQIVGPTHRRLLPVATGRRIPGGFGKEAYLGALADIGLGVETIVTPRALSITGTVGDLIGVAVKRG